MKIQNNVAFKGKLNVTDSLSHLATKKVKNVIRSAPKGTILNIKDYDAGRNALLVGFSTPQSGKTFITGGMGREEHFTEDVLLRVIRGGIEKMKKGLTTSWMDDIISQMDIIRKS